MAVKTAELVVAMMGIPKPMAADMNRIKPRGVVPLCSNDQLAGTRTPMTTMGVNVQAQWAGGLREYEEEQPRAKKAPSKTKKWNGSASFPKHLQILAMKPLNLPSSM